MTEHSDLPEGVITVTPTKIAEFLAVRWVGDEFDEAVAWMVKRFGWTHGGLTNVLRHGRPQPALVLKSKSRKRYTVVSGEWVIALGANGSLRVVSDKQYRADYREVSQ